MKKVMSKYPNLFSPIKIGSLTLKNRIMVGAMGVSHPMQGWWSPENIAAYKFRAKGGAAVVTTGETLVHGKTGNAHGPMLCLDNEDVAPSLIETAEAIKLHGAIANLEIVHFGRRTHPAFSADGKVYGPSPGKGPYGEVVEMDEILIEEIVEAYGDGALFGKNCGFDMVNVQAGHGMLLGQFLSPVSNQRKDRFGGSHENRFRIIMMIIDNIRAKG